MPVADYVYAPVKNKEHAMTHPNPTSDQASSPIDIKGPTKKNHQEDKRTDLGIEMPLKDSDDAGKSKESRDDQ